MTPLQPSEGAAAYVVKYVGRGLSICIEADHDLYVMPKGLWRTDRTCAYSLLFHSPTASKKASMLANGVCGGVSHPLDITKFG